MGSAEAAELAKLAETTYRDINIAFANELARYADRIGVDVIGVIDAVNSQPYSHIHRPGIAVGGHCIPVYPRFLLSTDPEARLTALVGAFVEYGVAHPAFVDCAQTLMRRTGPDLLDEMSESALFRLGRAISSCLALLTQVLEDGVAAGAFTVEDPVLLANTLYASGLGALQLARVGILVKEAAPGIPTVGQISADQVRDYLVASAIALARR